MAETLYTNRRRGLLIIPVTALTALALLLAFSYGGGQRALAIDPVQAGSTQLRVVENKAGYIRDVTLGGDCAIPLESQCPAVVWGLERNKLTARQGGGPWQEAACTLCGGSVANVTAELDAGTIRDITTPGDAAGAPAYATGLSGPVGVLATPAGGILVFEAFSGEITDATGGGDLTSAVPLLSGFAKPEFGIFDSHGSLFFSDADAGVVFKVESPFDPVLRTVAAFATGLSDPAELLLTSGGSLLVSEFTSGEVTDITGGGDFTSSAPFASGLSGPSGIAEESLTSRLFVSEFDSGEITEITGGGDLASAPPFAYNLQRPDGLGFWSPAMPIPAQQPPPAASEQVKVGGISVSGELAGLPQETADSSSGNAGLLAGVIAGATAGVVALGGVAWYARRRWLR